MHILQLYPCCCFSHLRCFSLRFGAVSFGRAGVTNKYKHHTALTLAPHARELFYYSSNRNTSVSFPLAMHELCKPIQKNCWINYCKLFGALLTSNVVKLDFNTFEKSIQTQNDFQKSHMGYWGLSVELLWRVQSWKQLRIWMHLHGLALVTGCDATTDGVLQWDCLESGQDYWNRNFAVLILCLVWLLQAAKLPPVPSSPLKCEQNKFCR